MPAVLYLFAAGNLVVGSSAFVVSGLVGPMAADLGVSPSAAGQAMTAYALATALGAPLAMLATGGWPRRQALLAALSILLAGNLICMLAETLHTLLLGRVLLGLGSMYTPLVAGIALAQVEPRQRGHALSTVFLGISASYVIGVPLGTWIGLRFGWHAAIGLMTAATALMLVLVAWQVPHHVTSAGAALRGLGNALRKPGVPQVLAVTLLYFSAIFTVFSYIAPVLTALVPLSNIALSLTLSIFGLAGMAGTLLGGRANDRFGGGRTMKALLFVLVLSMILLPLTTGSLPGLMAVLVLWGGAGFGMIAPQQARLAHAAPAQAPVLLSINASMLYLGSAVGAALGGALASTVGFAQLPWVAAPLAASAWALLWWRSSGAATAP